MEKVNVMGITSPKNIKNWKEKFECILDENECALFVSKDEFTSNDTNIKNFNYRYAIDCFTSFDNGKCTWHYALKLVVCPKSLDKNFLSSVAECSGLSENEVDIQDIIGHGVGDVTFGSESSEDDNIDYDIITDIANVFETMNSLRDFYLDMNWNTKLNGWDVINHCVNGEDMFKKMGL